MWIETMNGQLINCDELGMIEIKYIPPDYHIVGDILCKNVDFIELGSYSNDQICKSAISKIKNALNKNTKVFTMPTEEDLSKEKSKSVEKAKPCMSMEEAVKLWNTLADKGFKCVSRMPSSGSQRYEMLKARLLQYNKEEWEKCIDNIRNSDYLQQNQDKWFNFEWFIKPSNFPKVLDGNYSNPKKDDSTVEKWW